MVAPAELRLALVMNGGVSLAVWMGGVTHEIDLLRRASAGVLQPPEGDPDRAIYDAWRGVCKDLNLDVRVDVIAGTSAGGLNGTLLATAIARGAPLPGLQDVWRDVAQLDDQHLLGQPSADDAQRPENAASVLSGSFFRDRVVEVFRSVGKGNPEPMPQDVTLFVTSTAVGPQPRTILDSDEMPLVIQDHRRLYKFPQRTELVYTPPNADSQTPPSFAHVAVAMPWRDDSELLAHAARASASFPVAFPAVPETRFIANPDANQLGSFRAIGAGEAWLMDGGVLDNAPFGPVLDEIARAPIDTPRKRALVYVVPSVDESLDAPQGPIAPGWQRVLASALTLPRESDLRADVDAIARHAQDADRWSSGPQKLFADLRSGSQSQREAYHDTATTLIERYRTARKQGGINDALWIWAQGGADARSSIGSVDLSGLIDADGWIPSATDPFVRADQWTWGTAVADRALRLFLRHLFDHPRDQPTSSAMRDISSLLLQVAAVRDAVVGYVAERRPANPTADDALSEVNDAILQLGVPDTLNQIVRAAADACLMSPTVKGTADELIKDALVIEVVTGAFAADRTFSRPVSFDFFRFGPDIASPGLVVQDPKDANKSLALGPWKLWGTHLGHFAAFGREEWRDADWVWGRLDGIAHLVRLMAAESESSRQFSASQRVAEIQGLFLESQGLTVQELISRADSLATTDNDAVLARWSADEAGLDSILDVLDSALRTMRSRTNGNDNKIAGVGDFLTKVLARSVPPDVNGGRGGLIRGLAELFGVRRDLVDSLRNTK